eukprot:m.132218 g.132218  ORF g.132218 m.132218 type:complete len:262 (+) comp52375_c0_seq4:279-1064(+)
MSLCAQFPPFLLQKPTRVLPNCALPNGASSPPRTVPEMDRKPLIAFARRVAPALVAMARFHPSLPVLYEDKELVFSAAGTRITPPTQPSAQKPSAALTLPELKAPNFHKLLDTAKMSADELARALDWPLEDINSLLNHRHDLLEMWLPVFGMICKLTKAGLGGMLKKTRRPSASTASPQATEPFATVGQTMSARLQDKGPSAMTACKQALTTGWPRWEFCLTTREVDDFFAGQSAPAEEAAQLALRLAEATHSSSLVFIME